MEKPPWIKVDFRRLIFALLGDAIEMGENALKDLFFCITYHIYMLSCSVTSLVIEVEVTFVCQCLGLWKYNAKEEHVTNNHKHASAFLAGLDQLALFMVSLCLYFHIPFWSMIYVALKFTLQV